MNELRHLRRHMNLKRFRTAIMLERLQKVEPDPKKLKANFEAIFNQVFAPKQTVVETFAPKPQ